MELLFVPTKHLNQMFEGIDRIRPSIFEMFGEPLLFRLEEIFFFPAPDHGVPPESARSGRSPQFARHFFKGFQLRASFAHVAQNGLRQYLILFFCPTATSQGFPPFAPLSDMALL